MGVLCRTTWDRTPRGRPCGSGASNSATHGRGSHRLSHASPAESRTGSIPRRLPRDPGKRCPSLPGTLNVGRSLPQPWPALTCAGGRAALSPGPPDSEVQVWGHWTCPPGTCPLDRRCEGPQQVPSGRRGGTQLSPLCSWRRLPWTQLSLLLVTRELMEKPGSF